MPTTFTATGRVPDHTDANMYWKRVLAGEEDTLATVLVAILARHFGSLEWFEWEPDVLFQEIHDDLGVVTPENVRDQIWALVTAITTDRFYSDATFFNRVALGLQKELDMAHFEPADPYAMAWAVLEVGMNDLEPGEAPRFGDEVEIYVGAVLHRNGLGPLATLDWARTDTPGFSAEDPSVAAMQVQDRRERKERLEQRLQTDLERLRSDLQRAGVAPARR